MHSERFQNNPEWHEFRRQKTDASEAPIEREASTLQEKEIVNREDSEWVEVSKKWLEVHQKIQALENEEKALREALIQMAGVQNVTGGGIRLTRSLRKGNVQYSQIPELQNIDLEKYRKEPTEIWRLVPSDKKKSVE